MAITQQEADVIEEKFLDAYDVAEGVAIKAKEAWDTSGSIFKESAYRLLVYAPAGEDGRSSVRSVS